MRELVGLKSQELLWEYACQKYDLPEVERIALELQDDFHANVNIVLWCCWLASRGIRLPASCLTDVLIGVDSVSQMTVSKLRSVRAALKTSTGFTRVQVQSITKHILKAELVAEKILLNRLQDLTKGFVESKAGSLGDDGLLDLRYYLDFLGIPSADALSESMLEAVELRPVEMLIG
ncbi:MAG: TIGR02444 family protein [Alteromonadaceae bacterium]|nr:MAG: TIGR02444 family protein [Alteromonadaceae bacterium]